MYMFGRHDAVGLSWMGVERAAAPDSEMVRDFDLIAQLTPLIAKHQGNGTMSAVLLAAVDPLGDPLEHTKSRKGVRRGRGRPPHVWLRAVLLGGAGGARLRG